MQQHGTPTAKDEAVLLGLVATLRRMTVRTKLVKMVYLLDHLHFQQLGRQLTSFRYQWDHYGPNAVGNGIADLLDNLSARGLVRMTQRLTPYENYASYYGKAEDFDAGTLDLASHEWAFIYSIVGRYGPMSREQVVSASKETEPVLNANQYDMLEFVPNPVVEAKRAAILADKAFMTETFAAMDSDEPGVPLEEVRASVGRAQTKTAGAGAVSKRRRANASRA